MRTPHEHAEIIKAWADGYQIQGRIHAGDWRDLDCPKWDVEFAEFRVKPEPKPDIETYTKVDKWHSHSTASTKWRSISIDYLPGDNLKIVFDGETGYIKNAEVLK